MRKTNKLRKIHLEEKKSYCELIKCAAKTINNDRLKYEIHDQTEMVDVHTT